MLMLRRLLKMVKKICSLVLLLSIFLCPICYAQNRFEVVPIGMVEVEDKVFMDRNQYYPVLKVKGQFYLPLSSLEQMGATLIEVDQIIYIETHVERKELSSFSADSFRGKIAYMRQHPIYCDNIRSYALTVEEEVLVPLRALEAIWEINDYAGTFVLEEKLQDMLQLIRIDESGIQNKTDHLLPIQCSHIYWNGKAYEVIQEYILLEGMERKEWYLDKDKLYITTFITQISELEIAEVSRALYGQCHEPTFLQYSESIRFRELSKKFPAYKIEAQMKYSVGPFKEKDVVELCRSEKHTYFLIKDKEGKKHQVPYNSIRIIGEKGAVLGKITTEDIEDFIRLSNIESATDYLLWTDIYRQRTYVLRKQNEHWKLEKSFVCSTGKNHNPTPGGLYEVQYMIPYIGIEKGYRCKYALVFFRDYMYHSILFDKSGKYIKSGQYELGSKASHGCVRLSEKDSAWLYTHIPVKTTVWVR